MRRSAKFQFFELFDFPTLAYAALLLFPNLKTGDSRVAKYPMLVETVWSVLIVITFCAIFTRARKVNDLSLKAIGLVVFLFLLFLLPVGWTTWDDYSSVKVVLLFTRTFFLMLCPIFLISDRVSLTRFMNALALCGLVYALGGVWSLIHGMESNLRGTAFGSNPITLGRAASIPLIWALVYTLCGALPVFVGGPVVLVSLLMVLASGTRGAIGATCLAALLTFFLMLKARRVVRFGGLLSGLLIFLAIGFVFNSLKNEFIPEAAQSRVASFVGRDFGHSENARVGAFTTSVDEAIKNPLGIGWGGFESHIAMVIDGENISYPHNIIVEIFLEAGWLAGSYFLIMVVLAFARYWTYLVDPIDILAFAVAAEFLFNSLASGDVNGNQLFLGMLAIGLNFPRIVGVTKHRMRAPQMTRVMEAQPT